MNYWIIKARRATDVVAGWVSEGETDTWWTRRRPTRLKRRDRLFVWKGGASPFLIGVGECLSVRRVPNNDGRYTFQVRYLTDSFEPKLTIEVLRRDSVLQDASFLKVGPSGTVHPLSLAQGKRLEALAKRHRLLDTRDLPSHESHDPSLHRKPRGSSGGHRASKQGSAPNRSTRQPASVRLSDIRSSSRLATTHLEELWPDQPLLRSSAEVVARSIRRAHAEAPSSWELTLFNSFLRLNVGQIAVLELFPSVLVLYTLAGKPLRKRGYKLLRHSYRAVSPPTERRAIELGVVPTLDKDLLKRHFALVREAARAKRISPFQRSHSRGAVEALAHLAHGQVPQPEYSAASKTSQFDDGGGRTAGAMFGEASQNAEVERTAIDIATKHLQAAGWTVRSVEADRRGYDLYCQRGRQVRHVEVKGTRSSPTKFVMTCKEALCAQSDPHFVLLLVGHALGSKPSVEKWRGKSFEQMFQLEPLQYLARRNVGPSPF